MTINVKLIREKFCMVTFLPLESVDVVESLHNDFNWDEEVVRICGREYHERIAEIEYPADWWEAFKERWFKRFPFVRVNYKRFALDVAYPEYVPHESLGRHQPVIIELGQ